MKRFCFSATFSVLFFAASLQAGTQQLALFSEVQYPVLGHPKVIEGYFYPIVGRVYNRAPLHSDTGSYELSAEYAPPGATDYTPFPHPFTGAKVADGGARYKEHTFRLNTRKLGGGNVAVKVALKDRDNGYSVVQGGQFDGQFAVLHHSSPGLSIGGQLVALRSRDVITFIDTGPSFPGSGSSGTGARAPGMQGRSPTSTLNIDEITSSGSPAIISTLTPHMNLPSNSNPAEGPQFEFRCENCQPGQQYSTTFTWRYSDGLNDGLFLPGAFPYASQVVTFNVTIDMMADRARWTITVPGVVPEPSVTAMLIGAGGLILSRRYRVSRLKGKPFSPMHPRFS